jgi:hypothetical protein
MMFLSLFLMGALVFTTTIVAVIIKDVKENQDDNFLEEIEEMEARRNGKKRR